MRRFSPPDRLVTGLSPGGQRSASIAISSWLSRVQPSTGVDLLLELAHLGAQLCRKSASGSHISALISLKRSTMSATGGLRP
jgi:hypothetical protein